MIYLLCQISLAQNGSTGFAVEAKTVLAWPFGEDCSGLAVKAKTSVSFAVKANAWGLN